MVELTPPGAQWENTGHTDGDTDHRLGCVLSGNESRRPLAEDGKESAHKSVGVEVRISGSTNLCSQKDQHSCAPMTGQQNRNCLCQSEGWNTLKAAIRHCMQPVELVPREKHNSTSKAHSGSGEYLSRLGILSVSRPMQLDAIETGLSQDSSKMGEDGCGSICSSSQSPDQDLLQLSSRSGGGSSGCLLSELELCVSICIPSILASGKNSPEDLTREGAESGDNSRLGQDNLGSRCCWR